MQSDGAFAPESADEARELYESVGPAAQVVVRETATAMEFDREEYRERVTGEVVETARDALFASLLVVHDGTNEEFEAWADDYAEYEVETLGSENVDNVVWHVIPFADRVLAATYQNEPEAAAGTLRRQAFGRVYRELF
ncbi:DUF5809 family protein [Haloprofundus salinisoli]|uniref:DUF5809 family protein n=1 Tax=Haloprofundus salinisoli TaxID=2876193 RepID=UPI001CCD1231|nr:DUF5809 family protein [Haloprofundus salinisoli]